MHTAYDSDQANDMRFRNFQIARLFDIPVFADYTWLPVVALHIWLASAYYLPRQTGFRFTTFEYYLFGALMSALLFASILAHEFAHALMARVEGIGIRDIQLHIFGGWTRLEGEPSKPLAELRIAIAGPSMSFLVGLLFLICLFFVEWIGPVNPLQLPLREVFRYLFLGNLVLAMFNLLPGLPLDGGRAMRAWLWHRSGDVMGATRTAKRMGVGIAYMLSSFGIFSALWWGDYLTGVWMLIVGFFIRNVAESDWRHRQEAMRESTTPTNGDDLRWRQEGTVGAVMSRPPVSVLPERRIDQFIEETLSTHRHTSFPVAVDGRLHGILDLQRLRQLPREQWEHSAIREVMDPISDELFIPVQASIAHAARKLKLSPIGRLAVVDSEGKLVGYLSAKDLESEVTRASKR
ncbi:MAG: site-2 protease family protein [Acidobacteriota bacterium]